MQKKKRMRWLKLESDWSKYMRVMCVNRHMTWKVIGATFRPIKKQTNHIFYCTLLERSIRCRLDHIFSTSENVIKF